MVKGTTCMLACQLDEWGYTSWECLLAKVGGGVIIFLGEQFTFIEETTAEVI